MHKPEYQRDLLLVGGGHTHVLVLKRLAMQPLAGVRITLISDEYDAPYSGMLPGFVAGHYSKEQTSIDLNRLCRNVGARWIQGRVSGMRPDDNCVEIENQPELYYDCVSIDTGAQPNMGITWEGEGATCVKPIAQFHRQWQQLQHILREKNRAEIGIIGAGVGGVELCLALAYALSNRSHDSASRDQSNTVHLIFRGTRILPGLPQRAANIAAKKLADLGVQLHPEFDVDRISAECVKDVTGAELKLDHSFICTSVSAPSWLENTGLALSDNGFVDVNKYLQSGSHNNVFAAGDVADVRGFARPKAGVYAVRQAPFLADNLRRFFLRQEFKPVRLQSDFLKLISLGDQSALAVKYGLAVSGRLLWRWKNRIDRVFIEQFDELQAKVMPAAEGPVEMHCSGCGSKLGPELLKENLAQLPTPDNPSLSGAVHTIEDATVWQPENGSKVAQSIDGFRSFTADHYLFGQISVQHALNDLFAMGADPVHAQAWVNLSFSHPRLHQRDHLRLMHGVNKALIESSAVLAGGHSTEGVEDHLGIVVNGELQQGTCWSKTKAQIGDVLLLSKALGTGIILAADAENVAPSFSVQAAMEQMQRSNMHFFRALQAANPNAVTDVSGFGLLGHLLEMLEGLGIGAEIQLSSLPLTTGARQLAAQGYCSSLRPKLDHYLSHCSFEENVDKVLLELLLDPQTSGGLLAAVPQKEVDKLMAASSESQPITIIGQIVEKAPHENAVRLV